MTHSSSKDETLQDQLNRVRESSARLGETINEWNRLFNSKNLNSSIQEAAYKVGGYGTQALLNSEEIEKFAELIITECIAAIGVEGFTQKESVWVDVYRKAVARHFGYDIIFPESDTQK